MKKLGYALPLVVLIGSVASGACTSPREDVVATSDALIGHVPGSQIDSQFVSRDKVYLSARRIETLKAVGALGTVLDGLSARIDGIAAHGPADGRLSIAELVQIEKPGYIETLFPQERAALPELWKLYEASPEAPTTITLPELLDFEEPVDITTGPTVPLKPATLTIASLPANVQAAARRLELSQDVDGSDETVHEADVDAAIATPGPYLPAEVDAFKTIKSIFLERAGTSLSAKLRVAAPASSKVDLATWDAVRVRYVQSVDYLERRAGMMYSDFSGPTGNVEPRLIARLSRAATVTFPDQGKLVVIDDTTEAEQVLTQGTLRTVGGPTTIEVWQAGKRKASARVNMPRLEDVNQTKDLSIYFDYQLVTTSGAALVRSCTGSTKTPGADGNGRMWFQTSQTYGATSLAPAEGCNVLGFLATPALRVAAGRYTVKLNNGRTVDLDLFPEGVINISTPEGTTLRSGLTLNGGRPQFLAEGAGYRVFYNASTNELAITVSGTERFRGPLVGSQRTG